MHAAAQGSYETVIVDLGRGRGIKMTIDDARRLGHLQAEATPQTINEEKAVETPPHDKMLRPGKNKRG
jgi:hypothetical protein